MQLKSVCYSKLSTFSFTGKWRREMVHRRDSGTKFGKCRADGRMVANWGRQKLKCLEMEDVFKSFCRFPEAGESGVKAACRETAGQRSRSFAEERWGWSLGFSKGNKAWKETVHRCHPGHRNSGLRWVLSNLSGATYPGKKAQEYWQLAFVTFSSTGDPGLQLGCTNPFCSLCVGYRCTPTPTSDCKVATVWKIRWNRQKGNSGFMALGHIDQTFAREPEFWERQSNQAGHSSISKTLDLKVLWCADIWDEY